MICGSSLLSLRENKIIIVSTTTESGQFTSPVPPVNCDGTKIINIEASFIFPIPKGAFGCHLLGFPVSSTLYECEIHSHVGGREKSNWRGACVACYERDGMYWEAQNGKREW